MTGPKAKPEPGEPDPSAPATPPPADRPRRDPRLEIPEVLREPSAATRRFHRSRSRRSTQASDTARAFAIASEFIFSTLGGVFLGWLADRMLGTKPWGTLIGLALGFVGGMIRVIKATNQMGSKSPAGDDADPDPRPQ